MGILQLVAGALRWGNYSHDPAPCHAGIVNGLAIVIGLAQLEQFKIMGSDGETWMQRRLLYTTLGLIGLTMFLIWVTPKLTKFIPAPLMAIGIVTFAVIGFDMDVPRIGDLASLEGGLPILLFRWCP